MKLEERLLVRKYLNLDEDLECAEISLREVEEEIQAIREKKFAKLAERNAIFEDLQHRGIELKP